ncbi:MAG: glutamate synthase large subunit, partial [Candidatus Omnitrophica bacterium]|nr:glutamate synthase large subunit [Candidatus Omnitrophota bacterium]
MDKTVFDPRTSSHSDPVLNGLYSPIFEQDGCGTGFVAHIKGKRSHEIVRMAVQSVVNLTHRGAVDADAKTGDGAGLLTQVPYELFESEAKAEGRTLPKPEDFAVGMVFMPLSKETHKSARSYIEEVLTQEGLEVLGWRRVPVDPSVLGDKALRTKPEIEQILLGRGKLPQGPGFERGLYMARRKIEKNALGHDLVNLYLPSLSCRTLNYKGLLVAPQLEAFYKDLKNPLYKSAIAVYHQRYSTNTFPNWYLAQPFRMLGHNGEINTIKGNQNWMRAREAFLENSVWKKDMESLRPVIQPGGSDSADLDNALEFYVRSGRGVLEALAMMIPEAWQNMDDFDPDLRAFYRYYSCLMEPWDGPAAVAFTDGQTVGATLDRNGLRPARYIVTDDDIVIMASEVGVVEWDPAKVVHRGRLGPGQMIAIDTQKGKIYDNDAIKKEFAKAGATYHSWLDKHVTDLQPLQKFKAPSGDYTRDELRRQQVLFNWDHDEIQMILEPMMANGKEAIYSMGDDTPISVLSKERRLLYTYFRQLFAQVTNPPIDPLREDLVMSVGTLMGKKPNLLTGDPAENTLYFESPLLFDEELQAIRSGHQKKFPSTTLSLLFPVSGGPEGLEKALTRLCEEASAAVEEGKTLLILSDKGTDAKQVAVPAVLAVGAVHHHLIRQGQRLDVSLLLESAEPRDVHQIAVLLGYGVSCVNPYLTLALIRHQLKDKAGSEEALETAYRNYRKAVHAGLLKIMSKMGISLMDSYRGAQIFEIVGLNNKVVDRCFSGTVSRIGGIGFEEIARTLLDRHEDAYESLEDIPDLKKGGYLRFRKDSEYHAFNPAMIKSLHRAVRLGDEDAYQDYKEVVNTRPPLALHDLMDYRCGKSIPVEEVEPIEEICKHFVTPGMSLGALSTEAHETLAIAMNSLGAKSDSGEGGEDPVRFTPDADGSWRYSAIKQVASGRFGVTPH